MKQYKNHEQEKIDQVNEATVAYSVVDNNNVFLLINSIKKGIRFSIFKNIVERSAFNINEWSSFLHLSERTMQRYKKENKTFDPIYSEKIFEISMLFNYGQEVFGDEDNFNTWLQTKNVALGGIAPKELLNNTFGIRLVKDELTRIEHGVLA
jgi:putative toxin-antitoxin system antitoxin component (TIGR02293 family)